MLALACAACSGEIAGGGGTSGADDQNLATPDLGEARPGDIAASADPVANDPDSDGASDEPKRAGGHNAAAGESEPSSDDVAAGDPSGSADGADEVPSPSTVVGETADSYHSADLSELHVESGAIEVGADELALRSATVRATLGAKPRSGVEMSFEFRGASADTAPLASGELRRQIGIKLRAQNTCNVVYVMWHIAPSSGIHVSVKSNPGQTQHAECGDQGYLQLSPSVPREVAPLEQNRPRTLEARIDGTKLTVTVDGSLAWDGALPAVAFAFDGPVGLRSDNANFDVGLRVQE